MMRGLIDVWNIETFDHQLRSELEAHADLIRAYLTTERSIEFERDVSRHRMAYATNPYASDYLAFTEEIGRAMEARTIRAWHYTRLTNAEIDVIRGSGVQPSTLEGIRRRLDTQVAAGVFSEEHASALFASSPFQSAVQLRARTGKFWMVSHPQRIDDHGVIPLLSNWGGESVAFWLRDQALIGILARTGIGRVLEIAVPLKATTHSSRAGDAVVATLARAIGCKPDRNAFDCYVTRALGAEAIIAIHSEGEPHYTALARGYPSAFSDVRWNR